MRSTGCAVALGIAILAGTAGADDWPGFRGRAGDGMSAEKSAPSVWGPDQNIKWKAALPQPCDGSPIVSSGRVFLTCAEDAEGKRRSLYCFDRRDGKKLWTRTIEFGRKMRTHDTNPYCATTPAADGERVVVWHASAGLHCYDLDGKELWSRDLGEFSHMWGYATSPVLHEGKVILHSGPGKRSFIAAFDLKTGKTLWEVEEPYKGDGDRNENGQYMGSWCTPVVVKVEGKDQIICTMPTRVVGYDPADGRIIWWCEGVRHARGDLAYSSPVIAGDLCVVIGGFGGPGLAVRLGGRGNVTETHRVWRTPQNPQNIGSGVYLDGHIYWPLAGRGAIDCIDPKTGKSVWSDTSSGADHWGSAVYAAGRVYVTNQRGTTIVFKPGPRKFDPVATNRLNESSNSTPAISNGEIFIRTFKNLYCIAE